MAGAIAQAFLKVNFLRVDKLIFLAILCVLATRPAIAKCAFVGYTVSGTVVNQEAKGIAAATVAFTSVGEFFPKHPVIATTDALGVYQSQMRFDTYSGGGVNGDDCFRRPGRVNVRVEAIGYNPASKVGIIGDGTRAVTDFVLVRSPR